MWITASDQCMAPEAEAEPEAEVVHRRRVRTGIKINVLPTNLKTKQIISYTYSVYLVIRMSSPYRAIADQVPTCAVILMLTPFSNHF